MYRREVIAVSARSAMAFTIRGARVDRRSDLGSLGWQFTSTALVSVKRERSGSRRVKRSREPDTVTITARAADRFASYRSACIAVLHECIRRIEDASLRLPAKNDFLSFLYAFL